MLVEMLRVSLMLSVTSGMRICAPKPNVAKGTAVVILGIAVPMYASQMLHCQCLNLVSSSISLYIHVTLLPHHNETQRHRGLQGWHLLQACHYLSSLLIACQTLSGRERRARLPRAGPSLTPWRLHPAQGSLHMPASPASIRLL